MAWPIIDDDLIKRLCDCVRLSGSVPTAIKVAGIRQDRYDGWGRRVAQGGGSRLQKN
jgi:hypothetical protein